MYQKKTQVEHILLRPDTYIGSTETNTQQMWVVQNDRFVQKQISFVPGLFKIFDEILVNAADNKTRDNSMEKICVDIDEEGRITIFNDGKGIPVRIHKKEGIYIPELIFGHLLTSSNYDDKERKMTGGRNGYGAKLCNIFSKEFTVHTSDSKTDQIFIQTFNKNMSKKTEPVIQCPADGDYTKISFIPDFSKFGLKKLDKDHFQLFQKRAYDLAGCLKGVSVFFNGKKIEIYQFKDYVKLHFKENVEFEETVAWSAPNERWEVCCASSEGQFQQVSFVNNINTYKGGTHITHVSDFITNEIIEVIKKTKKTVKIKPFQIKPYIFLFVNCLIENPSFDSQTKENMTLKASSFGSAFSMSNAFAKQIAKLPIVENVLQWEKFREQKELKKTDGQKSARLVGVPKLDDAGNAGTKKADECTLILTEGDSAKTLAVSGLAVIGRSNYGVFPLRGKLLNVREAKSKQISDNEEVKSIKKILGLQQGVEYTSVESLRYGHIMMMTDQDQDGSHIKGLIINMIEYFWPSLLKIDGFLLQFITPIIRCTRRTEKVSFYTMPEYEEWKEKTKGQKGWTVKYYKGLGTSTAADARTYFSDLKKNQKKFLAIKDSEREQIDMAFNKKRAGERKEWLLQYKKGTYMDYERDLITYENFINKELVLFSSMDNVRSIPNVIDGLKPGQRKILYCCFKRNLKNEIKVAQLVGYIAEHSAYHHGENSLTSTIIGMAQNYVGSNNINLLHPSGQFGTRIHGGADSASSRYIYTSLEKITRTLFDSQDDSVLKYMEDDGLIVEPEYYAPIIPTLLVNGSEGIGTGWSTTIPKYNPADLIDCLFSLLDGQPIPENLTPWYQGFNGEVRKTEEVGKYRSFGIYEKTGNNEIRISELPIGVWTQNYKEFLERILLGEDKNDIPIKDYKEEHTETNVSFEIKIANARVKEFFKQDIETIMKLSSSLNITNMVAFDSRGKIRKYKNTKEIMEEFFEVRLQFYHKRKENLVSTLSRELDILENKARFITEVVAGRLVISKRKKNEIEKILIEENYTRTASAEEDGGFGYLLNMPLLSLTEEKVDKLLSERNVKKEQLESVLARTAKDMWRGDLENLRKELEDAGIIKSASIKKGKRSSRTFLSVSEKLKKLVSNQEDFPLSQESDEAFEGEPMKRKKDI